MINLNLLSKVSGCDQAFKNEILKMISSRYNRIRVQAEVLIEQKRWTACYLFFEQYLHDLEPYSQLAFVNDIKEDLRQLRSATTPEDKERMARRFMSTVELGLTTAKAAVDDDLVFNS